MQNNMHVVTMHSDNAKGMSLFWLQRVQNHNCISYCFYIHCTFPAIVIVNIASQSSVSIFYIPLTVNQHFCLSSNGTIPPHSGWAHTTSWGSSIKQRAGWGHPPDCKLRGQYRNQSAIWHCECEDYDDATSQKTFHSSLRHSNIMRGLIGSGPVGRIRNSRWVERERNSTWSDLSPFREKQKRIRFLNRSSSSKVQSWASLTIEAENCPRGT